MRFFGLVLSMWLSAKRLAQRVRELIAGGFGLEVPVVVRDLPGMPVGEA